MAAAHCRDTDKRFGEPWLGDVHCSIERHGRRETSPTRIAAQVVSGIGFLGSGVIIWDGLSIRELNTAATLWYAAGVGVLSGSGRFGIALVEVALGGKETGPPIRGADYRQSLHGSCGVPTGL